MVPAAPTAAFPGVKLLHIPLIVRYLTKLVGASTSFIFLMSQKLSGLVTGTRQFSRVLPKLRRDCSLARPNEKIVMYHPSNQCVTIRTSHTSCSYFEAKTRPTVTDRALRAHCFDFWRVHIGHYCVKSVRSRSYSGPHFSHIFPHSDWIRRDTEYLSVFCPNAGKMREKCGPE